MDFRPKMMLGVVAIVEENPVVKLPIATHSPGDRLVRVGAIMAIVSVQVAEAMAEIEERKEEKHVTPVNETDRFRWNNKRHGKEHSDKSCQLDRAPVHIGISPFGQFALNGCWIIAEKAEKHIAPGIFGFSIMTMLVDGNPIHGFAVFIGAIGVSLVMLHVHRVVISL